MKLSILLKRVLILDAASCLGMGAALALGAGALSPLFGIDPAIVRGAGVALPPVGAFILWLGTRSEAPAALVYAVILGNAAWVVESLLLASSTSGITPLGIAFVSVQAAAVTGLSLLEWLGLRQSRAAA